MKCTNEDFMGECEIMHIDEAYIAHGECKKCYSGYAKQELKKDKIFKNFTNIYKDTKGNDEQFKLLLRKRVFPYEYIDSWARFDKDKLPGKKEFYSKLNLSEINNSEYEHTRKVWDKFKLKNLWEYHDLYLKTDVLLLSNVFEILA